MDHLLNINEGVLEYHMGCFALKSLQSEAFCFLFLSGSTLGGRQLWFEGWPRFCNFVLCY